MTVRTRAQLNSDADTNLPDQATADVSPADVRQRIKDLADSALLSEDGLGMLPSAAAVSVLGRSANSGGVRADIAAAANDRILRRVSDAIDFGQLTAGMVPSGLITYAMLASAALATGAEFRSDTASKLLSAAAVWDAAELAVLTDGATIAVDMNAGFNFGGVSNAPLSLAGNRTLGNPTNEKIGQTGLLLFTAATSTRTLALSSEWVPDDLVEAFPISILTTETVAIAYWIQSTTKTWITGVLRRTT